MLANRSIAVIIPALNEEQAIRHVLQDLPAFIDQIIVVDNGSTDRTALVAKQSGAQVIAESRRGYGSACLAGISVCNCDIVAFIDGDYSDYPQDLQLLVSAVVTKQADLSIGSRISAFCSEGAMLWHQRAGNWFMCCLISVLHGAQFSDLGPMRCIEMATLRKLNMVDKDYGWTTEMQIKASQQQLAIKEIPVRYRTRIGTSKISGTLKGTLLAAYKITYWTIKLFISKPHRAT
ncbi:MAG: glycosyltransferase involved in cell wall biosynthesis [Saprospiraceae bacterium]|jgi:glycosyltransferase involved in cell wall biosynthesis